MNLTKLPPEVISLEFDAGWRDKRGPGSGFRIQPMLINGFFSVSDLIDSGFLILNESRKSASTNTLNRLPAPINSSDRLVPIELPSNGNIS